MESDPLREIHAQIKKEAEEQKVSCRNIRRDANKVVEDAEKAKTVTEDDRDKAKEKVQALLKTYEGRIDELAGKKEKEVMTG